MLLLRVVLLVLAATQISAFHFKRCNKTQKGLFLVRSKFEPNHVRGYVDKHVYLVNQVEEGQQIDNYTLKVDPNINTTVSGHAWGVSVRTDARRFRVHGNCTTKRAFYGRWWVYCNQSILEQLIERSDVLWITEIPELVLHSFESRRLLTGNVDIPSTMWNGTGIKMAVSDSGIDPKHCAFYSSQHSVQLGSFAANAHPKLLGIMTSVGDYAAGAGAHGTSCASIACGYPCAGETGVAPYAKLGFLDMAADESGYLYPPSNFQTFFEHAISHGVTIHSASWGTRTQGAYTDMSNVFDTITYRNRTFGHVVAAGNNGPNEKVGSPCTAKNPLCVGGAYSRPSAYSPTSSLFTYEQQLAFSSVGPTKDGRTSPTVLAPGYLVRAAYALDPPSQNNHANYHLVTGTSFATPAVAGLAALIQQRYKAIHGEIPIWSTVVATVIAHAEPATRGGLLTSYGTPIMNWESMIDKQGLVSQSVARFCFRVTSTEPQPTNWRIALAWIDVPAHPISTQSIINNLDMYVIAMDGTLIGEINDVQNTNGRVTIASQDVRVVVFAKSLSTANQDFSVHIQGKGTVADCEGTCIPSDYESCSGGKKTCDATTGLMGPCKKQTCSSGYCGEHCNVTCGLPCAISGGQGALINGSCAATSCVHPLFITQSGCKCLATTGTTCYSAWSVCKNDAFQTCAVQSQNPPSVRASAACLNKFSMWILVFLAQFFLTQF